MARNAVVQRLLAMHVKGSEESAYLYFVCLYVSVCMAWTPKSNLQSEGGEQVYYNSVPDCQNYCISLPQCVAIDYDTSSDPPCWIHNNLNNLLVVIENTAVTQYLLNRACLGTSKTAGLFLPLCVFK